MTVCSAHEIRAWNIVPTGYADRTVSLSRRPDRRGRRPKGVTTLMTFACGAAVAQRFPLAEARQAQSCSGKGLTGKMVLVCNGSSLESGAA